MEQDIIEKIDKLCSFVCNGKTYQYEYQLRKACEHKLYDASIIYAWNIFMLFIFEKIWQIREIEKEKGTPFQTDKIFLELTKNKLDDYFDGNLFSLNKLQENKQGEDAIIGKLKDVYKGVDQQYFREAHQLLQKRNTSAHLNSINLEADDLRDMLRQLIKVLEVIQGGHEKHLNTLLEYISKEKQWYLSNRDMSYIDSVFDMRTGVDRLQYMYIAQRIAKQEFSPDTIENIKRKSIGYFLDSGSFRGAEENALLLIKPLINYLNEEDICSILEKVFENDSHGYNQILSAGSIESIFLELYTLSSNNFPELQSNWDGFASKINESGHVDNFTNLIKEMKRE